MTPDEFWQRAHEIDQPLGEGEHEWYPYDVRSEVTGAAAELADPVTAYRELLGREHDPYWRELLLFLAAADRDPRADDLLLDALGDPGLRPRAVYLLGVCGTKGWPRRERDAVRVLRALAAYVDDPALYRDVVYGTEVEVGDLARAAFVRVAGPDGFAALHRLPAEQAQFVGLALTALPGEVRGELDTEIRSYLASI